jgi:hypothetical protein
LTSQQKREFGAVKVGAGRLNQFVTNRFRIKPGFAALNPVQREEVLKAVVSRYEQEVSRQKKYELVADLMPKLGAMQDAGVIDETGAKNVKNANGVIGGNEAVRRMALQAAAGTEDPTLRRKLLHDAVKLQELSQRAVGVRDDALATGGKGPEVSPPGTPVDLKDFTTPSGTLRQAVYNRADDATKLAVLRTAVREVKERYTKVADAPEGASELWTNANRMVGSSEGIMRAHRNELVKAGDDEKLQRKILHSMFNLSRDTRRFAAIRDLEARRVTRER